MAKPGDIVKIMQCEEDRFIGKTAKVNTVSRSGFLSVSLIDQKSRIKVHESDVEVVIQKSADLKIPQNWRE